MRICLAFTAFTFFLTACGLSDNPSAPTQGPDVTSGIALFLGHVPALDSVNADTGNGVVSFATGTLNPVYLDADASPLKTTGSRIGLNLFAGSEFNAIVDSVWVTQNGFTSRGHVDGITDGKFVALISGNGFSAMACLGESGTFRVESEPSGQYRVEKLTDANDTGLVLPSLPNGEAPLPPPDAPLQ